MGIKFRDKINYKFISRSDSRDIGDKHTEAKIKMCSVTHDF